MKSICITLLLGLLTEGIAQQIDKDTIRVSVRDFNISAKTTEGVPTGTQLAEMIRFGFYKVGIIKAATATETANFNIQGNGEFFSDEFYITTSITGLNNQTLQGPVAYGKKKELLNSIDELNNKIVSLILEKWNETGNVNIIALAEEKKSRKENNLPPDEKKELFYHVLSEGKNYPGWSFWNWDNFLAYTDTARKINPKIDALVELSFSRDKQGNTIVRQTLSDKTKTNIINLPPAVISDNYNTVFDEDKSELQNTFTDELDRTIRKISETGAVDSVSIANFVAQLKNSNDPSLDIFRAAANFGTDKGESYLILAKNWFDNDKPYEAFVMADKYLIEFPSASIDNLMEARLLKGEIYYRKGRYYNAHMLFSSIYNKNPDYYSSSMGFVETYLGKTLFAFQTRDSVVHAEEILSRIKEKPNGTPAQKADGLYFYARALKKNMKYKEAIDEYEEVLKVSTRDREILQIELFDCYFKWGQNSFIKKDYATAKKTLTQARTLKENDFNTNKYLIESLYHLKEFKEADALLLSVNMLELNHYQWANVLRTLFVEHAKTDNRESAMPYLQKSLEFTEAHLKKNPNSNATNWLKGNTLVNLSRVGEGITHLRKVFENESNNIGYRLDLAEAYIINNESPLAYELLSNSFVSDLPKTRGSTPGNVVVATFLKYVAGLVLFDNGQLSDEEIKGRKNAFEASMKRNVKTLNWNLFAFTPWLNNYQGRSKDSLQEAATMFAALAANG